MEIVNRVDKHVENIVEQFLDDREFLLESLGFLVYPGFLLLDRPSHHKDLQCGLFLIKGLDLVFVDVDVPVEVVHFSNQKLVALYRL